VSEALSGGFANALDYGENATVNALRWLSPFVPQGAEPRQATLVNASPMGNGEARALYGRNLGVDTSPLVNDIK
jgi:hypothetical protein